MIEDLLVRDFVRLQDLDFFNYWNLENRNKLVHFLHFKTNFYLDNFYIRNFFCVMLMNGMMRIFCVKMNFVMAAATPTRH